MEMLPDSYKEQNLQNRVIMALGATSILKWKGCKKQLGECVIQFWVQKKIGQRTQKKKIGTIMKTDVLLQFKIGILKQHYTTYNFDTFPVFS